VLIIVVIFDGRYQVGMWIVAVWVPDAEDGYLRSWPLSVNICTGRENISRPVSRSQATVMEPNASHRSFRKFRPIFRTC